MTMLANKVAIVTGASTGIGYAAAKLFAKEGAAVVVAARRQKELDDLADAINAEGGQVLALAGDVGEEAFAKALVDKAVSHFGGLDIAFNNAAILGAMGPVPGDVAYGLESGYCDQLNQRIFGRQVSTARHGCPKRRFINFHLYLRWLHRRYAWYGCLRSQQGGPYWVDSSVGVRAWASEYPGQCPSAGGTDTPAGREFANTPEALAFVHNLHALKRMATPEEIAQSALYLASDASSFTTGSAMLVDGGVSINRV